jgi:archaellum biogenesis protein FlaJ (TadC family)
MIGLAASSLSSAGVAIGAEPLVGDIVMSEHKDRLVGVLADRRKTSVAAFVALVLVATGALFATTQPASAETFPRITCKFTYLEGTITPVTVVYYEAKGNVPRNARFVKKLIPLANSQ